VLQEGPYSSKQVKVGLKAYLHSICCRAQACCFAQHLQEHIGVFRLQSSNNLCTMNVGSSNLAVKLPKCNCTLEAAPQSVDNNIRQHGGSCGRKVLTDELTIWTQSIPCPLSLAATMVFWHQQPEAVHQAPQHQPVPHLQWLCCHWLVEREADNCNDLVQVGNLALLVLHVGKND